MHTIAHFINSGGPGGAEKLVLDLTGMLCKTQQYHPLILGFNTLWMQVHCNKANVPFVAVPQQLIDLWSIRNLPVFAWQFSKFLKQHNVRLLHSHLYGATVRGALASLFARIPHVATLHDSFTVFEKPSRGKWLRWATQTGTKLISVSEDVSKCYIHHCRVSYRKIETIYNGVQLPKPVLNGKLDALRQEFNIFNGECVLISVGRVEQVKRFDLLVDTIRKLTIKAPHLQFRMLIVGDGSQKETIQKQIDNYNLSSIVTLVGHREDVPDLLALADMFILTSETEGLSYSILEAMSTNLPIAAFDVGGNRELVSQENGVLVPFGNIEMLATQLVKLIQDTQLRDAMGIESKRKVMTMFSFDPMTQQYLNVYNSLLNGN